MSATRSPFGNTFGFCSAPFSSQLSSPLSFTGTSSFFSSSFPSHFSFPSHSERRSPPRGGDNSCSPSALSLLASSLSAGYSLENALRESLGELSVLYGNPSLIVREFSYLLRQIGMNIPPEQAVDDFAKRSSLDDIKTFARVLRIARKSGGDLAGILRRTSEVIGDRIQIKEEILTLTAARRFEQRVMNLVPLFMILYVDFSSPGFFRVMYETLLGRIVMTLCLATYLFALYLSQRISSISL